MYLLCCKINCSFEKCLVICFGPLRHSGCHVILLCFLRLFVRSHINGLLWSYLILRACNTIWYIMTCFIRKKIYIFGYKYIKIHIIKRSWSHKMYICFCRLEANTFRYTLLKDPEVTKCTFVFVASKQIWLELPKQR